MRALRFALLGGAGVAFGALPALAESYTTRVEPRAFYGATVTIEEGVRVFRPLPPHDRVIINPGHKTPLYLGYETKRVQAYSENHNHNYSYDGSGGHPGGVIGGFSAHPRAHRHRHHGGHGHRAPSGVR